jgi:small subunit ribosomal protein S16
VAVKIKLKRLGKIRAPHYRIVVADSRTRRDGRAIEELGLYHPVQNPSRIEVDSERVQYWLGVGAQPTEPVMAILKVTGDWQKFKNLPAPEPMLQPKPKADKRALFEAAAKEAGSEPKGEAITPKAKKSEKKDDESAAADSADTASTGA